MVLAGIERVILGGGGQGILVPCPGPAGHAHHGVPGHGHPQDGIHPLGAVQHHAEAAVDGLAHAGAAAVVEGDEAHAPGGVAGVALHGHVRHDVGPVLDVAGLPEGGVGAAGVVVVPAQHHRTDLAPADHLVELQGDVHAAHGVLVQDAALGAHHQLVPLGVPDPDVVVVVLIAAVVGEDVLRRRSVGPVQVLRLPGQAAPAEGAVAEVEEAGPQDVLHIGGEDKAVQVVLPVFAHIGDAGVKDRLQEAVAVVEEVGPPVVELADHLIVAAQGLVHQGAEALGVPVQHLRALLVGQALGAVAAVVGHVAAGLVAHQIHVDVLLIEVLQQIHHVAVVGDGAGRAVRQVPPGHGQGLVQAAGALADPALVVPGLDAGVVHLGDDGHRPGDLRRLALGSAHAPQPGGHEQPPRQVPVGGDAQLQPPGVEQGVEGAVDDALGPDVHPAPGGHLAVVGHPQGGGPVEVLLVVEGAHHQAVGDDAPGGQLVGVEQPQGVAGHDHQGLLVGHHLQVLLDEAILHPVLADLSGLPVGHQLIGVEGHVEVQVVVDHHLEGPGLHAVSPVLVDGPAPDPPLRAEAVAVDPAVLGQLPGKLRRHLLVVLGRDVAQGVADGQGLVRLGEVGLPPGSPAAARHKGRVLRQLVVQPDGHGGAGIVFHGTDLLSFFVRLWYHRKNWR